jgi:Na+-transporting NADH:ubiquinone oxidoreductase subunit C
MKFLKEISFIFTVAFLFAGVTGAVNHSLKDLIRLHDETRNTRQLLEVLGIPFPHDAGPAEIQKIEETHVAESTFRGHPVYAVRDKEGTPEVFAFPIEGKGFWGPISGLVALNGSLDEVKGIIFTKHNETPGLGARIDEKWFRDQFTDLPLPDHPKAGKFIVITGSDPQHKNRIDAVTGATMTSTLLQSLLNREIGSIKAAKEEIGSLKWPSPRNE